MLPSLLKPHPYWPVLHVSSSTLEQYREEAAQGSVVKQAFHRIEHATLLTRHAGGGTLDGQGFWGSSSDGAMAGLQLLPPFAMPG